MKRFVAGVVTVFTTIALAACSSGASPAPGGQDADAGSGKGTITFSSHISGMDKVVAAFNASQSDVKVEFEQTPSPGQGGNAKLSNGIKAGNAPDLATVEYQDLPSFVVQGGIRSIDDLAGTTLGALPDGVKSTVTFGGKSWAVPYDLGPMVYYYREDVFNELGVQPPRTWDEFAAVAQTVSEKKPGTQIASFWPNEPKLFAALCWQAGARWFSAGADSWQVNVDDPQSTKVANFWQGLVDKRQVAVQQAFSDAWSADLQSGKVIGYVGAPWGAAGLVKRTDSSAGNWRVAPLPNWDEPASSSFGGSTFVITKGSKNAKAAATFASWLASAPEGLKARGEVGVNYPTQPALLGAAKEAAAGHLAHFGGQDIYEVFQAQGELIRPDWTWGPSATTLTTLSDNFGTVGTGGSIADALTKTQTATVNQLKSDGISVEAG